ncbi:hypothetical protein PQI51_06365 [Microbacterium esteraromaticum]|uniref:hypothetical protein n=1 Tax=Microbacterium esteraromaticum TaxID=57043 RepID=UPI0030AD2191
MRFTDGDLRHLFRFGIAMQKLDEHDGSLWCGIAKPHPENRDWIALWITDEMNTVVPREVEPDELGGYTFVDPWGGRRRIFPLPEARRVSFGTWDGTLSELRRGDDAGSSPGAPASGSNLVEAEHPAPEMAYFLIHYALNGYAWGVWGSPNESY